MGNETGKRDRRVVSRFFHALMILVYFLVFLLALISMGAFANLQVAINHSQYYGGNTSYGRCILNAEYDSSASFPQFRLNNNTAPCRFAIVGEAFIAFYGLVAMGVMVIKIICATEFVSCSLVIEFVVNIVWLLGSFSIAIVISIATGITCGNLNDYSDVSCSELTVPEFGTDTIDTIAFYNRLNISQVTAWLVFVTFVGIIAFYTLCLCLYAYGRRKARHARDTMKEELEKSGGSPQGDEHEEEKN